jgi:ABC-type tungstate transport system substrate-binding protein
MMLISMRTPLGIFKLLARDTGMLMTFCLLLDIEPAHATYVVFDTDGTFNDDCEEGSGC